MIIGETSQKILADDYFFEYLIVIMKFRMSNKYYIPPLTPTISAVTDGVTSPRSVPGGTVTTETPRLGGVNPAPPVVVHDPAPPAVVHDPGDQNHGHPVAQEVDRPVVVPRVRHLAVPDLNPVATQNPSPHVVQDPLDSRGQQEIGQEARNDQTLVIGRNYNWGR